jgi:hypothetical protein
MMQPVVDKLATKVADWADVYSVNIDRNPALASQYQISGVPTFVAFVNGEAVDRKTGALTEGQLIGLLKKAEEKNSVSENANSERRVSAHRSATPDQSAVATTDSKNREADASRLPGNHESTAASSFITIVSGLPRSGTSLMMRMLNAGGIPALCDEQRTPDADNPNGYYEFEDVKSLESYDSWLPRAPGHAVKMVYSLLKHLPVDREYRVIFMRRHFEEILQSQKTMLERQGLVTDIPDATLKTLFERELRQFYSWVSTQKHLKLINVSYNELLSRPDSTIAHIDRHLDHRLDTEAMVQVIDPALYRNRAA